MFRFDQSVRNRIIVLAVGGLGLLFLGTLLYSWRPPLPPEPEEDKFKLVPLSGNPQLDQDALDNVSGETFEYVTTVKDTATNQTVLVFRKGQLSNSQRQQLTISTRGYYLNLVWVAISIVGLLGLLFTFTSLRASVYSQVYQRYQTITMTLMAHPTIYHALFGGTGQRETPRPAPETVANPAAVTTDTPGEAVAAPANQDEATRTELVTQAVLSLLEEVYLLRQTLVPLLPGRAWKFWSQVIRGVAARPHFQQFLRDHDGHYDTGFRCYCESVGPNPPPGGWTGAVVLGLLAGVVSVAVLGAILFGCAGRWDLPMFWSYLGVCTASALVGPFVADPTLLRERLRPGPGGKDYLSMFLVLPAWVGQYAVAGLDVGRFHWSDTVPLAVQLIALALMVAAIAVLLWAVAVNRFFSSVIRIQTDRGHHLITSGPYGWVRHPGYACWPFLAIGGGLVLGSWLAALIGLLMVFPILRRTVQEDRILRAELPGYEDYARQVRYRLFPGVW